jgi:hypothetical protein
MLQNGPNVETDQNFNAFAAIKNPPKRMSHETDKTGLVMKYSIKDPANFKPYTTAINGSKCGATSIAPLLMSALEFLLEIETSKRDIRKKKMTMIGYSTIYLFCRRGGLLLSMRT